MNFRTFFIFGIYHSLVVIYLFLILRLYFGKAKHLPWSCKISPTLIWVREFTKIRIKILVHICTTLARSKSHHFWQNKSFGRVLQEHQRHVLTFLRKKKTHRKIVFQCQTNEPPSLMCLRNMKNFSTPLLKTNSYSLVFFGFYFNVPKTPVRSPFQHFLWVI